MSLQGAQPFSFLGLDLFADRPVQVEVSKSPLSSDAGLLIFRQMDERLKYSQQFADALGDDRHEATHSTLDMVRQRVYGILADYEDQNDHDALRRDPIFKLIAGRDPADPKQHLASQPTLSRFENSITIADLNRLRELFVSLFIQSFEASCGGDTPHRITLDLDAWDDQTHGQQQLTLFHGHYDQHQYYPLAITCADNDQLVLISLRHGTATASLGADDDLRFIVERLRAKWPDIEIIIRGDGGFGVPNMLDLCDELRLTYTFGYGMNPVMKRHSDELLALLEKQFSATKQPQREFVCWSYRARSWSAPRCTIVKVEVTEEGTNRRVILTNRAGGTILPGATYDEYADRGESENRHKELKLELHGDRLSNHRFVANYFRLMMHSLAYNLLVRQRQFIALPCELDATLAAAPSTATTSTATTTTVAAAECSTTATAADAEPDAKSPSEPAASPTAPSKKTSKKTPKSSPQRRQFNARRRQDPLGEGHITTWRTRIIKVACEVIVSTRRIVIRLSPSWPYLEQFLQVARANSVPLLT